MGEPEWVNTTQGGKLINYLTRTTEHSYFGRQDVWRFYLMYSKV